MARIRTIKPEFFTSDDICALSPLARLLYIGLWCHADREGRLEWKKGELKRRCLPEDAVAAESVCDELVKRGLVVVYDDGAHACIPTFLKHQRINMREPASVLPPPPAHVHAHAGMCGREGNGMEKKGGEHALPQDWQPSEEDLAWAGTARSDLAPSLIDEQTERFRNHAHARDRRLVDWGPAWRNWIAEARRSEPTHGAGRAPAAPRGGETLQHDTADQWRARLRGYRPGKTLWLSDWGPRPETGRSIVPAEILADWEAARQAQVPHAESPPRPPDQGARA